jgi:hypothetical protein
MRSSGRAVLAGLALATLCACTTIPTGGPVRQGIEAGAGSADQAIRVIAAPPRPGMSPTEIVHGFLVASASFADGFATARAYLTAARGSSWQPSAGVQVYAEDGLQLDASGSRVNAHGQLVATIGSAGEYLRAAAPKDQVIPFQLVRVDGEWRISNAPNGLLLSEFDVDRAFRSYDIYFFDPKFEVLVPDPVTVPVFGAAAATLLVTSLLAGPTPWLAKAVRSAFPADAHLSVAAVPIVNGVAQVDLSNAVLAADDRTRQFLAAQLVWTLKVLPEIIGVRITVGGQPFNVPGAPPVEPTSSWPALDPAAPGSDNTGVALVGDKPARLILKDTAPIPPAEPPQSPGLIAVAWDGATVAAVGQAGLGIGVVGAKPLRMIHEAVTGRPSFDRTGGLWWVSRGRLRHLAGVAPIDPKRLATVTPTTVPIPGLAGATLESISVARDGVRAVLIVRVSGNAMLMIGRITSTSGLLVDGLRPFVAPGLTPLAVAWADPDNLVVLGSLAGADPSAFTVEVARGGSQPLGAPPAPLTVAALPGQPVLIGAADGLVYQSVGGTWTAAALGANPAYPG